MMDMAKTAEETAAEVAAEHAAKQAALGYVPHPGSHAGPTSPPPQFPTAIVTGQAAQLVAKLHEGEPIFVFRAQDILSVMVLSHYATLLEQYGDLEMIEAVVKWRNRFQEWQRSNPGLVKLPD